MNKPAKLVYSGGVSKKNPKSGETFSNQKKIFNRGDPYNFFIFYKFIKSCTILNLFDVVKQSTQI